MAGSTILPFMLDELLLKQKFDRMWPYLDERSRRMFAANEAVEIGYRGVSLVSRACGLSRVTITKGMKEIVSKPTEENNRIRKKGAGRHKITKSNPEIIKMLESIVEDTTRGDPESPLRWTCKSTRSISDELSSQNHIVSHTKVLHLLRDMDYSLQSNRKTKEGADHPDRNEQFEFINSQVKKNIRSHCPVISVDTKKKELIGNYSNKGQQWLKSKSPKEVNGHDFPDPAVPRAYPYGIYDIALNRGFVNIGTDHDTSAFAVASIKGWWRSEGKRLYSGSKRILITADGGGSNGYRRRLWKLELQGLAQYTGLAIHVCHFPPGTSKWNKIEHRLFSFISSNWRGEPLRDYETIVNLISNTTTSKGLTVKCRLDRRKYPLGRKVSEEEFSKINLTTHKFHGEWNYVINPNM